MHVLSMSKQVSPPKVSSILQKTKIGPKCCILPFLHESLQLLPSSTKLNLFKAAILPYLTYCHIVWHFCCASDRRKLKRIQERALRAIYCDKT